MLDQQLSTPLPLPTVHSIELASFQYSHVQLKNY